MPPLWHGRLFHLEFIREEHIYGDEAWLGKPSAKSTCTNVYRHQPFTASRPYHCTIEREARSAYAFQVRAQHAQRALSSKSRPVCGGPQP